MPRKPDERRFTREWWAEWTMPEPNTGCHIWMGSVDQWGYGRVWKDKISGLLIHRIAYECAFGAFDSSLKVCHRCDMPSCVNPDHLFLGTQKDNLRDMFSKGRARPRGRAPGWRDNPTVAAPAVARVRKRSSVTVGDPVHLIGSSGVTARWRHVTGTPAIPQDHDGPSCRWPRIETAEPATGASDRLPTSSTVAPICGLGGGR